MLPLHSPVSPLHDEGKISTIRKFETASPDPRAKWIAAFRAVRAETERRAAPLGPEDQVVQSMPDCSPTKWHRAHTTWFFDQFVLDAEPDPRNRFLWNSYYEAIGDRQPRAHRGLLTRPTCDEVAAYRQRIDEHVSDALPSMTSERLDLLELGCHH